MSELVIFGSELDEIEDEEKGGISRRPLGVQDQVVCDERGRRRFHGAFMGGFSAGYFNTVGSKEGWTPKQFRSSRDERGERFQQSVEDYLDEEDVGEYGIASRRMHTTLDDNFLKRGDDQKLAWERSEQSNLNASLSSKIESLIRPVSESIGVRLLKKMGWREGQGIGPKMSRRTMEKHKQNEMRSRGRREKFNAEAVNEAEEMAPGFEFAPEDVLAHYLHSRNGTHGLGYEGLRKSNVLSEQYGSKEASLKTKRNSKGIRGQAFGVGAFEEDDESIYSNFDFSQYDFAIGGNDAPSSSSYSYDLTFVMAEKRQEARRFFAAPHLPRSFRPQHRPILLDITLLPENVRKFGEKMTHFERAKFLGEVDKNVVMELIRDEDRKRLKAASSKEPEKEFDENLFEEEPQKQARFKQYIQYLKRGLHYPQPVEMTSLEWERELAEFQRLLPPHLRSLLPEVWSRQMPLARVDIAMPMAQILSSKFTSASSGGSFDRKRPVQDEDRLSAVRMKMFGEMTRQSHEWHPATQLAKRFNVPDPYPSSNIVGVPHLQKIVKTETLLNLGSTAQELQYRLEQKKKMEAVENANEKLVGVTALNGADNGEEKDKNNEQTEEGVDEKEKEEKLPERPSVDFFKAIFADSDDEDIEDEGEDENNTSDKEGDGDKNKKECGDDERLNGGEMGEGCERNLNESTTADGNLKQKFVTVMDIVESDDEQFGPAPPPTVSNPQPALPAFSVVRQNRDNERKKKKKHKKEEKKHKKDRKRKKSAEHQSHRKHSKHRKHKRSSTDSDDGSSSIISID